MLIRNSISKMLATHYGVDEKRFSELKVVANRVRKDALFQSFLFDDPVSINSSYF